MVELAQPQSTYNDYRCHLGSSDIFPTHSDPEPNLAVSADDPSPVSVILGFIMTGISMLVWQLAAGPLR
jgi:hypothetical protein